MKKKINWKVRFKNPVFLAQVGLAIILPILTYFGVDEKSITTWQIFFDLLGKAISNPYVILMVVISVWNTVNDPTTKGISDSASALTYEDLKEEK